MNPRGLRKATIALAALLIAAALPIYAWKVAHKTDYTDFEVYYRAATRLKHQQWDLIYTLSDGASPFRYAPPLLLLFRPFAELSADTARVSWYALQYVWFALGFWLIYLTLGNMRPRRERGVRRVLNPDALWVTAASVLFVLRLCLDTFTIGQVSSLLFLAFAASFRAWVLRRPGRAGAALFVPAVFKIGPGFLYSLLALRGKARDRFAALAAPAALLVALNLAAIPLIGSWMRLKALWMSWWTIVANDSVYYDASHYGSQSIKSALLRLAKAGWLSGAEATTAYLALAVIGCAALIAFWFLRKPLSLRGRGLFFSLGVFPYLWFMPETFKYSLTALALPVAMLLSASRKGALSWIALACTAASVSLPGLDIVGPTLFFGIQRASLPLLATLLLAAANYLHARRESEPETWILGSREGVTPWEEIPAAPSDAGAPAVSCLLPLPLGSTAPLRPSALRQALASIHAELEAEQAAHGRSYELLLVPYGNRASELHPTLRAARALVARLSRVRLIPSPELPERAGMPADGRGAALRAGFLASRGRLLYVAHLEQPCEAPFLAQALERVAQGCDLVRANRRLPESRFRIPVRYLSLVYGRHRLGLRFNRLVRWMLPAIRTTDTHSGTLVMSRRLAECAFALQSSPGFLFDLELSLVAATHGFREQDLPVRLYLAQEKTPKRIFRENYLILRGLPLLARRYRRGCYHPIPRASGVTADDWGLSPGVNQGILELARLGVVRRVSLMARSRFLGSELERLRAVPGVELGLHFDLTYGKGTAGRVLLAWLNPLADRERLREEVRAEFSSQLEALRQAGVEPSYVDGHHHIHLVPGILDSVHDLIRKAGISRVRLPYDPDLLWTSKAPLVLLSLLARSTLRRHGFAYLPCFYPQPEHFRDHGLLRARLARDPAAEVIVHPARTNDLESLNIPDPYTQGRVTEFRALRMLALAGSGADTPS